MALEYEVYGKMFDATFRGDTEYVKQTAAELGLDEEKIAVIFGDAHRNTSIADYVWLPLKFEEPSEAYPHGRVQIEWLDEGRIEDFEEPDEMQKAGLELRNPAVARSVNVIRLSYKITENE